LVIKYNAKLTKPLNDKPALLGTILNGKKENFFQIKNKTNKELLTIFEEIIK
jgi:hypothetical protein